MADYCTFCEIRRPAGGTNHLVLNDGAMWIEFCPSCGEKHILRNGKDEAWLVRELFNACAVGTDTYVRDPMDVVKAELIAAAEDRYASQPSYEEYWGALEEQLTLSPEEKEQLTKDYWDELEYSRLISH